MPEPAEQLITIFGGGGFIGRYVCEQLLKHGVRVRVAARNPRCAHFIQPLGQVGQVGYVRCDITVGDSVRRAIDGSSGAINLCGVFGKAMWAVHVGGARTVAEAARDAGLGALVQISAIGADQNSQSRYGQTKAEGEAAVRAAFPKATIVRPSLVFGPEDELTNRFAAMARLPILPVIAAERRFQPVYVKDLAKAIAAAALDPDKYGGKIFEIGGPQVLTMRELHAAIAKASGQAPEVVELPNFAASLISRFGFLPGAPITRDQWLMLQNDNVVSSGALGIETFGIKPTPLGAVAPEWLGRFRRGGRFGMRAPDSALV